MHCRQSPNFKGINVLTNSLTELGLARHLKSKRNLHDLAIHQRTGKPVIGVGTGGRSSVSGHVATVFGCTGFLGRYVVNKLESAARTGTQVIVPYRGHEDDKRHLKLMGDLGQIVPLRFDLRDPESVHECVRHSDTVYNLIGRDYETKNFSFEKVHIEGAALIAAVCAQEQVSRLIHVSSMNVSSNSPSHFLRTKYEGEKKVREAFADATIVRTSTMFGAEDRFLNRVAKGLKYHFLVSNPMQKLRPVSVSDVALVLRNLLQDETMAGKVVELYGPKEYTLLDIENIVADLILKRPKSLNLPKPLAKIVARGLSLLPWHTIGPDEIEKQYIDDKPSSDTETFASLNIVPASIEDMALQFVRGYRSAMYYELTPDQLQNFRNPKPRKEVHTIY